MLSTEIGIIMRISRIFVDMALASGTQIEVPQETAHYLGRVLRLREGAELNLFNGQGGAYQAQIVGFERKSATLAVGDFIAEDCESPLALTLVQGVARNEHMDVIVQKAVELGVRRLAPVICARTQRGDPEKFAKRHLHWQKIIINACEQCGRNSLMELLPVQKLDDYLVQDQAATRWVLAPGAQQSWRQQAGVGEGEISILVGPEGGFADDELEQIQAAQWQAVSLGPRILRTETAALSIAALLQAEYGDLR